MSEDAKAGASPGWAQRRERVMLELEHVALELFTDRGYEAVSYEDIAERAGRSWRTVYRYYPTKEAFLLNTPRRASALSVAAVEQLAATSHPFDDYFDMLETLTAAHTDQLGDFLLWARVMRDVPQEIADRIRAERTASIGRAIVGLCATGLGVPVDDVRAVATAAAIAGLNQSVVDHWIEGNGKADLGQLFEVALEGLRVSLRPREAVRGAP